MKFIRFAGKIIPTADIKLIEIEDCQPEVSVYLHTYTDDMHAVNFEYEHHASPEHIKATRDAYSLLGELMELLNR